ncbi:MAG: hypothetical protein GF332_01290 [Candidatus Moranbacteria bacterium]|nr:hypothetical protein [Candidatus Moranbacteria bacterium]
MSKKNLTTLIEIAAVLIIIVFGFIVFNAEEKKDIVNIEIMDEKENLEQIDINYHNKEVTPVNNDITKNIAPKIKNSNKSEQEQMVLRELNHKELVIDQTDDRRALGYPGQRKIVRNKQGDYFIAYRKKYQGDHQIYVAKLSKVDSDWRISGTRKPVAFFPGDLDQRVPSIDIDEQGTLHLVWYGSDQPYRKNYRQIKYTQSQDGLNWQPWRNIAQVQGYSNYNLYWQEHPYIDCGENGIYIVWEGKDQQFQKQQVKFIKSTDKGQTWSEWKNVNPMANKTQSRPLILQDSKKNLHLLMYASLGQGEQQIQYAKSKDQGETWTDWQSLSNSNFDSRHFSASMDEQDRIYLVWRIYDTAGEKKAQIMLRTMDENGWGDIRAVESKTDINQFFPGIAVQNQSQGYLIAWIASAQAFGLPREDPLQGDLNLVLFDKNLNKKDKLTSFGNIYYPSLIENFQNQEAAMVFLRKNQLGTYDIVVNLFI